MASWISSAYNYYLSTYGAMQASRYDSHRKEDLRNTVNQIKILNKESPLYKIKTSKEVQEFAIDIKESTRNIKNLVASFSESEAGIGAAFHKKIASSSNPEAATAKYIDDNSSVKAGEDFELEVLQLAAPQTNIGNFLKKDARSFSPGSYSFDLNMNTHSYEFQYNVNVGDTNEEVLRKLARLVNNAHIGLKADILNGAQNMSALRLESRQTGLALNENSLFQIVPENSEGSRSAMQTLGIDAVAAEAENASFLINGAKHTSADNTFTVNNSFSVTLKNTSPKNKPIKIGFKPGAEVVADDIQLLVDSFNSIIQVAEKHSGSKQSNEKLLKDMGSISKTYAADLNPMGLTVLNTGSILADRGRLSESVVSTQSDAYMNTINHFKDAIGKKAEEASINPMNYVGKVLVTYKNPNPNKNFACPYITSAYAGMMVDRIC